MLRQEFHNNQNNNNAGEHVDESSCMRDARNDWFTKEPKQPVYDQDQDTQEKQEGFFWVDLVSPGRIFRMTSDPAAQQNEDSGCDMR